MQAVEQAGPRFLHADTSAFALFGDYPNPSGPSAPVQITYGHSKDHRPDLRQIMMGLTVDDQGQVVAGTMLSGNTSDRQWHPDRLEQLAGEVPEDFWRGSCYISDAAVVTHSALTHAMSFDRTRNWKRFAKARFLRIAPALVVVILFLTCVLAPIDTSLRASAYWTNFPL